MLNLFQFTVKGAIRDFTKDKPNYVCLPIKILKWLPNI